MQIDAMCNFETTSC